MQRKPSLIYTALKFSHSFSLDETHKRNPFTARLGYLSSMFLTPNRLIIGLFTVLLLGAAYFSLERILFCDASYILFRLINSDSLQIQEQRYGSFITQSFPLLAARLHLPLKMIVVLYSISFNLFYLAVALLLLYRFREYSLGVLMSFYYVLFVSDTYFWVNNEVHQGIAWMFLFFALIVALGKKKTHRLVTYPTFILLAFLTLYTHPLLLFPTAFLWLFFATKTGWPYRRMETILLSVILIAIAVSKLMISTSAASHYDVDRLQSATHPTWQNLMANLRSPLVKELAYRTIWNYWIVPILLLTGLAAAVQKKAYWHAALTIGFSILYLVALCLTFNDFKPFYTESELMPLSIILATPFVYYALPQLTPKVQVLLLASIFLVRLVYIGSASQKWIDRKNWLMSTLQTMRRQHISKAFVPETEENQKTLIMNWGTPTESMLASALNGDKPQSSFVVDKPGNFGNRMPPGNAYLISSFDAPSNASLNQRYFSFDTTAGYQVLNVK